MINLIKSELRKTLGKKSILIIWILFLGFSGLLIRNFETLDTYSDVFSKIEGCIPFIGLVMFIVISGNYTKEYESSMVGLINSTKNGRKNVVIAKAIANGIALSLINISAVLVMGIKAFKYENFQSLDIPIKQLWYFENSGSNITVLQMYLIVIASVIVGSFVFAQIGLALSSAFKSATMPFILGGLIMGISYFGLAFVPEKMVKFMALTPNWMMMSQLIVRNEVPIIIRILSGIVAVSLIILLPMIAYKNFVNSKRLL